MIKAVLFDLDDTLISEKMYIKSGYRHISNLLSINYEKDEHMLYQLLFNLQNESPKNVFNRLFNILEITYNKEQILDLVEQYRNHSPDIMFFDDVKPCIDSLKK